MNKNYQTRSKFHLLLFFLLFWAFSFGQTTLFQFDFQGASPQNPNINNTAGPVTGGFSGVGGVGFASDNVCGTSNSMALIGNNWQTGDFYVASVNTTGFSNLEFSFCNRANNTNNSDIRAFDIRYSTDNGNTITPVPSSSFTPSTLGGISSFSLPSPANNRPNLLIYVYKTINPSGQGNGAMNPASRTLYLDNVTLRSCPTTAGTLSGDQYLCRYNPNQTTTFSSTVSGGTWSSSNTGIATVNSTTGLVTGVNPGTATITYSVGGSGCPVVTATRDVYVANNSGGGVSSISGASSVCQGNTATYTIVSDASNSNHIWSFSGTGVTFVVSADTRSAVATFASNATSGSVVVNSVNSCGTGYGNGMYVTVGALPTAATISGTTTVCVGASQPNITFSNPQNFGVRIYYNINGGATQNIYVNENQSSNLGVPTGTAGTFTYNLVRVENGVGSPSCFSPVSGSATVTVSNAATAPTGITGTTTICSGSSTTLTLTGGAANGGTARWYSGSCGGTSVGTGNSITVSPTSTTTYFVRFEGGCNTTTCASTTVNVNATVTAGSIGNAQTICSGSTPATLSSTAVGTGSGTISYEWQSNASGSYVTIPDATTATFAPQALTTTTSYQRRTVSVFNGVTCYSAYTTPVTISVSAALTVASAGQDQTVCGAGANGITLAANAVGAGETGIWTFTGSPAITNVNSPTTTVTLAPGTSSTFTWTITRGSCSSSDSVLITNNASSPISGTLNVCAGATTTLTSSQSPTNSGNWSSATPAVATVSNTGIVTGVAAGTSIITYVNTFGCPSSVTVTVNARAVAPTIVSITQPNCTLGTGSVTLSGLPAGDWDLTQSGFAGATISGSGSETTINGLAPGTYYYTVTGEGCTSNLSQAVVINPVQTTTFNAGVWTSEPTLDKLGIIEASGSPIFLNNNTELCSCEVRSGANVIVNDGFVLKLQDRLVVDPAGSLTINNNSSLVQINDGANNSGDISYLRQTTVVRRGVDYTYWSSPVAGQNLLAVSPNTNQSRFWSFTPGGTWFVEKPDTKIMDIGKGYIIRAPDVYYEKFDALSSVFEATFTGKPNNGNLPVGVAGTFNLIGNPYPSAIDAIEFLEANQSVLNGTIYFWTHNTAIRDAQGTNNEGTGDLVYIQDDYASFNRTGGVATAPATTDPDLASGNPRIPTGKIAAGQSFFASRLAGSSGTTVLFNNSMRLGVGNSSLDNSQFFRTAGTSKKDNESTRNRIWLNVTNKQKAFKQILVGYLDGATNDFDPAFDGATYNANTIINFYSMLGTRRLSIQGRALPFDTADTVPLGYNAFIDGEFSISIDNVDGLFSSQAVYLEDKVKNTIHNLKTGPYTFQTVKGAFNDRFVLRYTDRTLGVDDLELKDGQVILSVKNKQLKVTSTADAIKDVYIYDLLGKLIFVKKNIGTTEFLISNLASSEQVLIVKTVLQNEAISNLKTIYK